MMKPLLFISLLAAPKVVAGADDTLRAAAEVQLAWIRLHGGFQSPKIELLHSRHQTTGFIAADVIHEDETLFVIPEACLLSGLSDECDTAENLVREVKLGNESKYAPYLDYAFESFKRQMYHPPSMWSDSVAKTLLDKIIGRELPPRNVTGISFQHECDGASAGEQALEEYAYAMVVSKGWYDTMIPLLELIPHRNGKWHNVKSSIDPSDGSILVKATRDIVPGQVLHQSFNECENCDFAHVLQDIFKDSGIIEDYPRRWRLEEPDLIFELDQVNDDDDDELTLTWLTKEPSTEDVFFIKGHLARLKNLNEYVTKQAAKIESTYERDVTLEYYHALVTALEYASLYSPHDDDTDDDDEFDPLDSVYKDMEFNTLVCDHDYSRHDDSGLFVPVEETESFYQSIIFTHSEKLKDTCLYMDHYLHTCISWRSHYHEYLVHYAARYVKEVKRVLFIGGGDSMLVHEVLKYPSLELVVGLELDQAVVRKSFKNMGTQPHFDDERVQWWFGDATTSLLMLPTEEYYGTFDLVVIDLAQEVVEMLSVTDELDINDAAMLLAKSDGVVVRNEDWNFGTNKPFAKHTVDIYYVDVPMTCHQGLTLASNGVDFLSTTPKDHRIETVYLKPVNEIDNRFHSWYNYRKSTNVACKEVTQDNASALGILMVIEAEDVEASMDLSSAINVSRTVSQALQTVGLTEISVKVSSRDDGHQLVFILNEGYVVVQTWPSYSYCAFDVMLWRGIEKLESIKSSLVAAVGSKSVSSYRIVTSGMFGADNDVEKSKAGPHISLSRSLSDQETEVDCSPITNNDMPTLDQSVVDTILKEGASLIEGQNIMVLCGDPSSASPCHSLQVLEHENVEPIPVYSWPSLVRDPSHEMMMDFAQDTLASLLESVDMTNKFNGIVIDPQASQEMGQVLHKLLSNTRTRRELLAERHVVLTLSTDPSESMWRHALLDRLRTDIVMLDPSHQAEVLFTDTNLELGIFSSGNDGFFSSLVNLVESIETKTNLSPDIRNIKHGINHYVADFEPSNMASHDDYDYNLALWQWKSQKVLGEQTVIQFEAAEDLTAVLLEQALIDTLSEMSDGDNAIDMEVHDTGGAGSVIVGDWTFGSVVLTWDGKRQASVNLYSSSDPRRFERLFMSAAQVRVTSRNEMPRGTGRVVNFASDVQDETPRWS